MSWLRYAEQDVDGWRLNRPLRAARDRVLDALADQQVRECAPDDADAGKDAVPPGLEGVAERVLEHRAPARRRRRLAEAEVAQGRRRQERIGSRQRERDEQRPD